MDRLQRSVRVSVLLFDVFCVLFTCTIMQTLWSVQCSQLTEYVVVFAMSCSFRLGVLGVTLYIPDSLARQACDVGIHCFQLMWWVFGMHTLWQDTECSPHNRPLFLVVVSFLSANVFLTFMQTLPYLSRVFYKASLYKTAVFSGNVDEPCAICLDAFNLGDGLIVLRCRHYFHTVCIQPWFEAHVTCPTCRSVLQLV